MRDWPTESLFFALSAVHLKSWHLLWVVKVWLQEQKTVQKSELRFQCQGSNTCKRFLMQKKRSFLAATPAAFYIKQTAPLPKSLSPEATFMPRGWPITLTCTIQVPLSTAMNTRLIQELEKRLFLQFHAFRKIVTLSQHNILCFWMLAVSPCTTKMSRALPSTLPQTNIVIPQNAKISFPRCY